MFYLLRYSFSLGLSLTFCDVNGPYFTAPRFCSASFS
jgi:hypothetical protein